MTSHFKPLLVTVSPDVLLAARDLASQHLDLKGSFTNSKGALAGAVGEILFEQYFFPTERINNFEYDFLFHGHKVDIKCKRMNLCGQFVRGNYSASISAANAHDDVIYFHCRVRKDYQVAWLLGWGWKSEHTGLKQGKVSQSGSGATWAQDSLQAHYEDLHCPEELYTI